MTGPGARPLRALLFDLDGTLADTASANVAAYRQALAEAGVAVDSQALHAAAFGRNWRQFLPPLLHTAGSSADPATVAARKQQLYADAVGTVRLHSGLLALLASCRPLLRTALVTTASRANVQALLQAHGLAPLFDLVLTGDDVRRHKPDPEAYLLAAQALQLAPAECLVFEDSDIGLQSAQAAGMRAVRVTLDAALTAP